MSNIIIVIVDKVIIQKNKKNKNKNKKRHNSRTWEYTRELPKKNISQIIIRDIFNIKLE
jgi:hypothetical protein